MVKLAKELKAMGVDVFRAVPWKGGVFVPKDPSGWGCGDVKLAAEIKQEAEIEIATEVKNIEELMAASFYGYLWSPARQMQNYQLIRSLSSKIGQGTPGADAELGEAFHPPTGQVLIIKRATNATTRDIGGILSHSDEAGYTGPKWICERGVVAFNTDEVSRWRLDLQIIPQIKERNKDVKIMVDVSHAVGRREYVLPMAKAAVAAGCDGIMIECCAEPDKSPSDGRQTIDLKEMSKLMEAIK